MMDKKPDPDVWWILDKDGQPKHPESYEELEEFSESDRKILEQTYLVGADGDPILVSTVFLPCDHGFGRGLPVLWETMVFKGETSWDQFDMDRYRGREEALVGHAEMVERVKRRKDVSESGDAASRDDR